MVNTNENINTTEFEGNIYIFHAFDIGDDIDLEKIEKQRLITKIPLELPKFFKHYHIPMQVELPHPHTTSHYFSSKLHSFGVVSLIYKVPFKNTLQNVRIDFENIVNNYQEQSIKDARTIFNKIESCIDTPHFFHTTAWHVLLHINPKSTITLENFQKEFGGIIASTLRFETETLAEEQKTEMLESAIGYFRGNLVMVDQEASCIYDDEHKEVLDLFEFANIQHLELQYFDQMLDTQLDHVYDRQVRRLPLKAYLPFASNIFPDPVEQLGKLRADISVITERLENTIKLSGEPYLRYIYESLVKKLDLNEWKQSIERKLQILHDVRSVYQHKTDAAKEDLLTVLIIILIFTELVIGILEYLK